MPDYYSTGHYAVELPKANYDQKINLRYFISDHQL